MGHGPLQALHMHFCVRQELRPEQPRLSLVVARRRVAPLDKQPLLIFHVCFQACSTLAQPWSMDASWFSFPTQIIIYGRCLRLADIVLIAECKARVAQGGASEACKVGKWEETSE